MMRDIIARERNCHSFHITRLRLFQCCFYCFYCCHCFNWSRVHPFCVYLFISVVHVIGQSSNIIVLTNMALNLPNKMCYFLTIASLWATVLKFRFVWGLRYFRYACYACLSVHTTIIYFFGPARRTDGQAGGRVVLRIEVHKVCRCSGQPTKLAIGGKIWDEVFHNRGSSIMTERKFILNLLFARWMSVLTTGSFYCFWCGRNAVCMSFRLRPLHLAMMSV